MARLQPIMRYVAGIVVGAALISAGPAWSQSSGNALNALHQQLHLSSEQDLAWNSYRAAASTQAAAQDRRSAAARMFPNLSSPQRMDLVEAEMKQELVDLQRQSHALKAFYMILSPGQKAIFDARTLPPAQSQQQPGQ